MQWIESYAAELEAIGSEPPPAPRWNQDWFPRLDAAAAYAMVRTVKPRRIVEVGSGHSTRFLARAVADGGLDTRITAIDPKPRASLAGLDIEWIAAPVQRVAAFPALGESDILFIDSSHQLKPGSDVDFLLNAVLPLLPQGVRVHFHDIFLPDDYPEHWAWRRYNEQPAVSALIKKNFLRVDFSSHATVKFHPEKIQGALARVPLLPGAIESSLWLTRN
ncbi:MAG TPA: class I SAM-dependent methyltransferase [Burkholderiales bacterium]|nr:class I SAM-dependent methyltransferase [Burkholderiales bacterium]